MRAWRDGSLCLLMVLVLGLLPLAQRGPLIGLEVRRGDTVTVGPGEVVDRDLVILSRTATVQGTVNGTSSS